MPTQATVESVNVGQIREVRLGDRVITTAIWKQPVAEAVTIRGVNLAGDDQADRSVHGGPDKAVYAYAVEDTAWWEQQEGRPLGPAPFGENLSTSGIDLTMSLIGERWKVGTAVLEVCQPRVPCFKLGLRHGDPLFPKKFVRARRPGAYLRIIQEGIVEAGDPIEIIDTAEHGLTIAEVSEIILHDHSRLNEFLAVGALPESLRAWAAS